MISIFKHGKTVLHTDSSPGFVPIGFTVSFPASGAEKAARYRVVEADYRPTTDQVVYRVEPVAAASVISGGGGPDPTNP